MHVCIGNHNRKRVFPLPTTSTASTSSILIHETAVLSVMEALTPTFTITVRAIFGGVSPIEETRTPPYPSSDYGDRNIESKRPRKMEDRIVGRMIQGNMSSVVPDEVTHKYS
jgi:hypothetical protein